MSMDKIIVGKRIRYQREKQALTREQFAELVTISPQFLAEIENGSKGMSADTLYKICENVDVTADYLLFGRQSAGGHATPGMELLSAIPPKYSSMAERILEALSDAIKAAEPSNEEAWKEPNPP